MRKLNALILFSILALSPCYGLKAQTLENSFANAKLEHNFIKFTAAEIVNDFQKAIREYNTNRKIPKSFSINIPSAFYRAKFEDGLKGKSELPEIVKRDGHYALHDGPNRIVFSIDFILKNQFYFNGKLYSLDKDQQDSPELVSSYFQKVIDLLVTQAMAGEQFVASSESTRTLIAGIIALDTSFEKIGFTCILTCKEKVTKINREKLVKRINGYKAECEKNLEDQDQSMKRYSWSKDIFDVLTIGNSDFEKTYQLLTKMSEIQKKDKAGKIISKFFEQKMSQQNCFDQIKNTYKMWINNARLLTVEREEIDQQVRNTCEAINALKSCLSDFHAQSASIFNSTNRHYKQEMKRDEIRVPNVNGISR